jgi:hypothetical protein
MASALVISNFENPRIMNLTTAWQLVDNLTQNREGVVIMNPLGGQDVMYRILAPGEVLPAGPPDLNAATPPNMPDGYVFAGQSPFLPCKVTARVALAVQSGTQRVKVVEIP